MYLSHETELKNIINCLHVYDSTFSLSNVNLVTLDISINGVFHCILYKVTERNKSNRVDAQ